MKQCWGTKALSEVCEFRNGLWTGKKPPFQKVGVIRNTNFTKDGKLDDGDIVYLDVEQSQFTKRKLQHGDIILEKSGGGPRQPVGRVIIFDKKQGDFSFSNFTSVLRIIASKAVDFTYLHRFLFFLYVLGVTEPMQSHSTGIRNLKFDDYKAIKIPLPPLTEQQRIVAILDEAFSAIEKAKANTEQNIQNAAGLFEAYLNEVFENKGQNWEEKKLLEICELNPQKKEARDKLKKTDYVTFLPMKDLGVLSKEIHGLQQKQLKDVVGSYTYFAENDVLLAKITPCFENGKIGIARNLINGIGFGSSEYIVARTQGNIEPEFLYYFLSRVQIRDEGKKYMTGAVGHKRVSKEWIENYLIPFPQSIKVQRDIIKKLDKVSAEIKKLEEIYRSKINNLEELKKSILEKAFNGELTRDESFTS